jgi:outer membrane protein assembly factor BamB/tRNA A-37 threonylcarbamoyl transferase component Bud32
VIRAGIPGVDLDTHRITQDFNSGQLPDRQLLSGLILVNRYEIQEVIGVGGMGSVYRARDLHFPNVLKLVAVKEMINQARDPLVRQTIVHNFEREANLLVTLNHPSIPKIYDYFTHEERSYLVLEYVHGKDLDEILSESQGFFPEEQVVSWAVELCDVLSYLHGHKPEPIIFRDMKPSNVMVDHNNHIVLVDFGIAKVFRSGQKGTMIGTEGYSPPEQYRGEATQQADIYALGATLHHILTRSDPRLEPPFTFTDRPIRKANPAVSAELETVVSTALQYNPSDRFANAEAMKEALLAAARKTGLLTKIAATSGLTVAKKDNQKPIWTFKAEDEIRGSILYDSGTLYFGSYDNNVYALNAANGEFAWKFASEGGIVSRPVVVDGQVIFGSEDGRLYSVLSRTGKLAWTYPADAPIRSSPAVSEGHAFFGSDDGYVQAVNIAASKRLWRFDTGESVRSSPCINGELVYIGSDSGDFFALDFRGQIKWRFKAKRSIISSPTVVKNQVYFSSLDGMLYALDAKTGWLVWRFRMGKGSVSSPCVSENFVFVGSADGHIYCIETGNAREVWRFQTEHQVSGSPVIYKDSLYCGSADGNLYCLEYRTGRLRWKFSTGGPITSSPIVYNDILYVGSSDHILYALLA